MSLAKQATEHAKLQNEVKELRSVIERQAKTIASQRAANFKLALKGRKRSKGARFCRVCIPDSHGTGIDPKAARALLDDLEIIKPAEVVMLGDHLDCGGFLAQHHTVGYVSQTGYTFEEDVQAANQFLDNVQQRVGRASYHYIEGNHERRLENWCVTQALKNGQDAQYLLSMFSADVVLNIQKRGMRWVKQNEYYDDVPLPATIKLGNCFFTHGSSTSKHAAHAHLQKFGGNVVYGHTHRMDSYFMRTVKTGGIGAWSPGCLCKLQPSWQHTNPTDWAHGYGLQLVMDDDDFLHINVPIIAGKSLLAPLIDALK